MKNRFGALPGTSFAIFIQLFDIKVFSFKKNARTPCIKTVFFPGHDLPMRLFLSCVPDSSRQRRNSPDQSMPAAIRHNLAGKRQAPPKSRMFRIRSIFFRDFVHEAKTVPFPGHLPLKVTEKISSSLSTSPKCSFSCEPASCSSGHFSDQTAMGMKKCRFTRTKGAKKESFMFHPTSMIAVIL